MAAEPVKIQGSDYEGKIRSPIVTVALSIVTLGIYYLVWYFKVNKEMAEIGKSKGTTECGTSPGTSLAAFIPGVLIIVPPYVSLWNSCKRLGKTSEVTGAEAGMDGPLMWLLLIFIGPVGQYLFQAQLNKALEAQSGGGAAIPAATPAPAAPAVPETEATPPPPPPAPTA